MLKFLLLQFATLKDSKPLICILLFKDFASRLLFAFSNSNNTNLIDNYLYLLFLVLSAARSTFPKENQAAANL